MLRIWWYLHIVSCFCWLNAKPYDSKISLVRRNDQISSQISSYIICSVFRNQIWWTSNSPEDYPLVAYPPLKKNCIRKKKTQEGCLFFSRIEVLPTAAGYRWPLPVPDYLLFALFYCNDPEQCRICFGIVALNTFSIEMPLIVACLGGKDSS